MYIILSPGIQQSPELFKYDKMDTINTKALQR